MRKDSRLSSALHIVLHLGDADGPITSETLAKSMQTNPVVVRRMMAGLRERGIVTSEKGHGGGWRLVCDLENVTLRDIYEALAAPDCIALTLRDEAATCLVERAVNIALKEAFDDAEALLLSRFDGVTLAALKASVQELYDRIDDKNGAAGHV